MKGFAILGSISLVLIAITLSGCSIIPATNNQTENNKLSCTYDSDCVCGGIDKDTKTCFVGNIAYYDKNVDTTQQCPDFCTGIDGNMKTKCIEKKCMQIHINTLNACTNDTDCVRENSCCDCGLGNYINKKYQTDNNCVTTCKCAIMNSIGKCIGNQCIGVQAK